MHNYAGKEPSIPQKPQLLTHDKLQAEFSRLLLRIRRLLSQSPNSKNNLENCKEYCIYLKASDNAKAPLFTQEKRSEINNCRDFREFFEIVSQHLSWDEHSILTEIINECDSDEAKEEISEYKKKMALCKALEIINSTEINPPPEFEKFCVIIDQSYKKLTTEKYEEIKKFIFDNLDTHRYVTNEYIRVLFGCLHLEWHVTTQAIPHMIKTACQQQAVFKNNSYVFMQIGKEIIFDVYAKRKLPVSKFTSRL